MQRNVTSRPPVRKQNGTPRGAYPTAVRSPQRPAAADPARSPQRSATRAVQRPVAKRPTRSAAPYRRSGGFSAVSVGIGLGIAALVIAVMFVFQYRLFPEGMKVGASGRIIEVDNARSIRITEVMSSNASALQDDTGAYPDWIEVTNVSRSAVDLKGYKIAKDASRMLKYFEFPNHTLQPGESTVVYCTSTTANTYGYGYHAPFKISAAGDTLVLFNATGAGVQTLTIPEMKANESYAEINGQWVVTMEYTPFLANTSANHMQLMENRSYAADALTITEFMAKNCTYCPDENGEYCDWIELYNSGTSAIDLNGYALSDSATNIMKWRFPSIRLQPGQYLVVYASGYDRRPTNGNPLHTNFRLATERSCVILVNPSGQIVEQVGYDLLNADQSYSRQSDGTWTTRWPPTPGMANTTMSAALISSQFAAQNTSGLMISEVMASTSNANSELDSYDWLELHNTTGSPIDLSGMGLSDRPNAPRKWQFPQGASIPAYAYMCVFLSGENTQTVLAPSEYYHTNFSLSRTAGETVVLARADGTIIDRVPLMEQYTNTSYGRIDGQDGFFYMEAATPNGGNVRTGYRRHADPVTFSVLGGLYDAGTSLTLTLSAEPETTIYYTLDCSDPTPGEINGHTYTVDPSYTEHVSGTVRTYRYTGPIPIHETTIVRAIAVCDGWLDSYITTQTYFVGVQHTMDVVSLVTDPENLWSYNSGIYVKGPNATATSPYGAMNQGANFWMDWEKFANFEMFSTTGETILSQACGIKIHGQFCRADPQKAFKVIARSAYGTKRFEAPLFDDRPYTEYQSFLVRASGQDDDRTRMRDAILQSLTAKAGSSVMYQDDALSIVYLNGYYWGHYNLRERINAHSIVQWEVAQGHWSPDVNPNDIDLIKANTNVMQGSVRSWTEIMDWIKANGIETSEKLEHVKSYIDVYNYLEYVAIQMFSGNTDLLNCKKYRCASEDGVWRWVLFDMDWAFDTNTNSPRRWLTPGGVGNMNRTDNSLFIALMKNPEMKDWFLRYFAEQLATVWSTESVVQLINARRAELEPEMAAHMERWNIKPSRMSSELNHFLTYARERPGRLLYFFQGVLSEADMQTYFGEIMKTVDIIVTKS